MYIIGKTGYYIGFLNSNNISNPETQNPIYHLLEKSGENTFINGMPATNETLFRTRDSFGYSTFSDFTFNSGAALEYKFTVSALSSTSATINFVLKNAQMI